MGFLKRGWHGDTGEDLNKVYSVWSREILWSGIERIVPLYVSRAFRVSLQRGIPTAWRCYTKPQSGSWEISANISRCKVEIKVSRGHKTTLFTTCALINTTSDIMWSSVKWGFLFVIKRWLLMYPEHNCCLQCLPAQLWRPAAPSQLMMASLSC